MNFSAVIPLGIFSIVFLGLVVMAIVHIFHAWRFGAHSRQTILTSAIFLLGIGIIVVAMVALLLPVDWGQSFELQVPNVQFTAPPEVSL